MTKNLNTITSNIIKNSISSAIYIDDSIIEPFASTTTDESAKLTFSSEIYNSFRKESKSLDFYRYLSTESWQDHSDYLFKNRDLLILDWQLNEGSSTQHETLRILKKAVKKNNLHFVTIYTYTDVSQFSNILYSIKAFFNPTFDSDSFEKCEKLVEAIDNEGIDTGFFQEIRDILKEYTLSSEVDKKEIIDRATDIVRENVGNKLALFFRELRNINHNVNLACEILGYYINKEFFIEKDDDAYDINLNFTSDNFIVINNTIIQITNKNSPKPDELFPFFTDALTKVCGNLLTLSSIEIKNLLKQTSSFLDTDINNIQNTVLFHQKNKKENFFEFLLAILKNQTLSLFDYKQDEIKTLTDEFWEQYSAENDVPAKISLLEADSDTLYKQLANLNIYYNELSIKKSASAIVKFGDIFSNILENGKNDGTFFLCITAHCDCLRPSDNIKNNFYFIRGEKQKDIKSAIEEGDGEFNSYIRFEGSPISIKWNSRPIVIKIENNRMNEYLITGIDGLNKSYSLKYISTLKESYAQRMANNSFSFAMRVGIDFSTIK